MKYDFSNNPDSFFRKWKLKLSRLPQHHRNAGQKWTQHWILYLKNHLNFLCWAKLKINVDPNSFFQKPKAPGVSWSPHQWSKLSDEVSWCDNIHRWQTQNALHVKGCQHWGGYKVPIFRSFEAHFDLCKWLTMNGNFGKLELNWLKVLNWCQLYHDKIVHVTYIWVKQSTSDLWLCHNCYMSHLKSATTSTVFVPPIVNQKFWKYWRC